MSERRPPGFNVDLGFYDSPEVLSIPRKHRAAAVGVWTLCGAYSANKLTDGLVSAEKLRELGCTPAIKEALMATRPEPLWVPSNDHPGAIQFTRWTKWQRTRAEVKAYRDADAERKRKAREAVRNAESSDDSDLSARTEPGRPQDVRADSGSPRGRARARQTETETKTEEKSTHLSSNGTLVAADHDGLDSLAATPGADLVREIIPREHPAAVQTALRLRASELINTGTPKPTVAAALRLWLTKPNLGPSALPALVSEVIKNHAPTNGVGKPTQKALGYRQLGAELINEIHGDQP